MIFPQLSDNKIPYMDDETKYDSSLIKTNQAINADYTKSNYDKVQLSPDSFQCGDRDGATFTLTNSAPMNECFHKGRWKKFQDAVRDILLKQNLSGTAYLVTGTVPDPDNRIPTRGDLDPDRQDFNRVTVPSHIWTAVCYISPVNEEESFSFGYIGVNKLHSDIDIKSVTQLTSDLSEKYQSNLNIFQDDCFSLNAKSEKMVKELYNQIELPQTNQLTMSHDIMNILSTASGYSDQKWKAQITEVQIDLVFNSLETWQEENEKIKYVSGLACVLSKPFDNTVTLKDDDDDDMRRKKRQTSEDLVCRLVSENLNGCTTSCLYNGDYYCFSGTAKIPCSPTYSVITVNGKKCKDGHTCGKNNYDYYWCYTEDSSWDYCSPPPPLKLTTSGKRCHIKRNCSKYGRRYSQCENEDGNIEYCCEGADPSSTLYGKTCKSDHQCGKYNKSYLWCYTTDGSWDYCCNKQMNTKHTINLKKKKSGSSMR